MVALAIRHPLTALQRRGMTELRVVAHRSVDVEHAPFADERVAADRHRADMDEVRLRAIAEQARFVADDAVVTDRHKVGTDRRELAPQDHVAADPGAHQAQIGVVERCADEGSRRRCAHQGLDGPEAEICKAPDRNRLRLEAADQQPFCHDGNRGQRNKHSCAEGDASRVELQQAVGGGRPLNAGHEDPETEQQIGRVEPNLQGAACDVRQGRRNVEGFRVRCDRSVGRRIEMMREPGDRRMHVDIAHRHVRHARIPADRRTDTRHQQRVGTEIIEKVVLGRDMLGTKEPGERGVYHALAVGFRRDIPLRGGKTLQLRLGQPLVVGLVAQRHRYGVDLLEEGRHHVDGKLAAQSLRDLATRQLHALLESVIGDDFDDALLGLECRHGGLSDLR